MSSLRWVWSNLILFTFRYLVLYQLIQNAQPAVSREMRERKRTVLLALQISIYLLSFPGSSECLYRLGLLEILYMSIS